MSERIVRARLDRKGYALCKCRSRNPDYISFGLYRIVDPVLNCLIAGGSSFPYELTLQEADEWSRVLIASQS